MKNTDYVQVKPKSYQFSVNSSVRDNQLESYLNQKSMTSESTQEHHLSRPKILQLRSGSDRRSGMERSPSSLERFDPINEPKVEVVR